MPPFTDLFQDTPWKASEYKVTLAHSLGAEPTRQYRLKRAEDMATKAFGADNDQFFAEFFPPPPSSATKPLVVANPFEALKDIKTMSEAQISAAFRAAVNDNNLAPGMKMAESEQKPDHKSIDKNKQKPDAALFFAHACPTDGRPHWPDQLFSIEFKDDSLSNDPFDDGQGIVAADAKKRTAVRAQVIGYAELLFAVQQRTVVFMFLIIGRKFRVLRWDRAGTIVTTAVDYYDNWELMCDILWRISQLTPAQMGFDESATRLHPDNALWSAMDAAAKPHSDDVDEAERELTDDEVGETPTFTYVRSLFRESLVPQWPRYCLNVPDGEHERQFLVCKPTFRTDGMAGRGTRGYVALDCTTGRFVWLKDAWRAHYLFVDKEGDVLAQLNDEQHQVPHVPTLVCHGDIAGQETISHLWWARRHPILPLNAEGPRTAPRSSHTLAEPSSSSLKRKREDDDDRWTSRPGPVDGNGSQTRSDCPLRQHQHYRVVVEEVALPLIGFRSGKQLVSIVYDCVKGHYYAMDKAKIIHRDVSGGNILILPKRMFMKKRGRYWIKWTGLLVDWELSMPVESNVPLTLARQPERTGTWQFMSVGLLDRLSRIVTAVDELESFLHVLHYYSVRYLQSNCTDVGNHIEDYFDAFTLTNDAYTCGSFKQRSICEWGALRIIQKRDSETLQFDSPLDPLFETLVDRFYSYYLVDSHKRKQQEMAALQSSVAKLPLPPVPSQTSPLDATEDTPFDGDDEFVSRVKRRRTRLHDQRPTREDEALAQEASEHKAMLALLIEAASSPAWPKGDKVADRVDPKWQPKRPVGPIRASTILPGSTATDGSKRPRMDSEVGQGSSFRSDLGSLPIHPHRDAFSTPNAKRATGPSGIANNRFPGPPRQAGNRWRGLADVWRRWFAQWGTARRGGAGA
ncbi:hypothetical protein V8D89_004749 [Ganoderma adspersum]